MKLIYHSKSSLESGISPFVATLAEFEGADPLCIACPYIGFSFFASLVNRAEQWRLVTDIGEWLASTPTKQLSLVHRLIKIETGRIRHFPGIHAKVFWRPERALIGSANLTEMGLLSRTEFGVELTAEEDGNELQEIHDWYEWIWSRSTPALNVNLGLIMFARSESPAFALNEKRRRAALEGISQAGELGISPLSALSKNRFSSPQRLKKAVAAGVDRTVVEKVVGVSLDIESPVQKSPSSRPIFIELDTCASVEDQIVFKVLQAVKLLGNTLDRERGFLMSEISGVLDEQIGGLSFHDLYFALIHSTANNPRGAFTTDSRFVLWVDGNGYFHEGSGPIAQSAVVDTLLALVTSSLSKTGTLSLSEVTLQTRIPHQQIEAALISLVDCGYLKLFESLAREGDAEERAGADVDYLLATGCDRFDGLLNRDFYWLPRWVSHFTKGQAEWNAAVQANENLYQAEKTQESNSAAYSHIHPLLPSARSLSDADLARIRQKRVWKSLRNELRDIPELKVTDDWILNFALACRLDASNLRGYIAEWITRGRLSSRRDGGIEFICRGPNTQEIPK